MPVVEDMDRYKMKQSEIYNKTENYIQKFKLVFKGLIFKLILFYWQKMNQNEIYSKTGKFIQKFNPVYKFKVSLILKLHFILFMIDEI